MFESLTEESRVPVVALPPDHDVTYEARKFNSEAHDGSPFPYCSPEPLGGGPSVRRSHIVRNGSLDSRRRYGRAGRGMGNTQYVVTHEAGGTRSAGKAEPASRKNLR